MNQVKEAFQKVKEDISFLKNELNILKNEISQTNNSLNRLYELFNKKNNLNNQTNNSTDRQIIKTDSTNNSTHNTFFKASKPNNLGISTRNEGVSTDRQTDRQTNRQTNFQQNYSKNQNNKNNTNYFNSQKEMGDALDVLNSLDNIKKEIRNKFKRLTPQEMLVFSTIYQLEEEEELVNYKAVSQKINLSESSVRDYVWRIIKKGIPVEKTKINNKSIHLKISSELRKIATLNTIVKLRDL